MAKVRPAFPILNKNSILYNGLISMVAAPLPQDLVQQAILTGILRTGGFSGIGGAGLNFINADDGIRCTAPKAIQIASPLTIATHFAWIGGAPDNNANIFGVSYNSTETDPFLAYALTINNSSNFGAYHNSAGIFQSTDSPLGPVVGKVYSLICTFKSFDINLYVNGVVTNNSADNTLFSYGSGPILAAGELISTGRKTGMNWLDGMIWNRILSTTERNMLDFEAPWDLYWQPSNVAYSFAKASTTPVTSLDSVVSGSWIGNIYAD